MVSFRILPGFRESRHEFLKRIPERNSGLNVWSTKTGLVGVQGEALRVPVWVVGLGAFLGFWGFGMRVSD